MKKQCSSGTSGAVNPQVRAREGLTPARTKRRRSVLVMEARRRAHQVTWSGCVMERECVGNVMVGRCGNGRVDSGK